MAARHNEGKKQMTINPNTGSWKVDPFKGGSRGELSKQWMARPADERFLTLDSMFGELKRRHDNSTTLTIRSKELQVLAPDFATGDYSFKNGDHHRLGFAVLDQGVVGSFTHYTFGQVASLVQAPAAYLRTLPSPIVADNLDWGLRQNRQVENVKLYYREDEPESIQLQAVTGPDYGRIPSYEVVDAVRQVTGSGHWKIPGVMDWTTHTYDPHAPVTMASTTLFGSDKDMFIFLVDDTRPIEVGKLADGSPDYMFRGFYVTNSEVGASALRLACFYLRAVCCNRILWGVENFEEISIRHSKMAPDRWLQQAVPALRSYSEGSANRLIEGVAKAKEAKVARDDEEATEWLKARGFSKARTKLILETVEREEGRPMRTAWDAAQGITAIARNELNTDNRLELEVTARKVLDAVA